MKSVFAKTGDGTITLTVSIPKKTIDEAYQKKVEEFVQNLELKGFRKGKVPRDVALKNLDKSKVYEEVIKTVIPASYIEALKEHNLSPILQPEIKLAKAKEGEDWQFTAKTCEKPRVNLGDYKAEVQKIQGELKKDQIWVPGKPEKEKEDPQKVRERKLALALEALLKSAKAAIPEIILETEITQRMTKLVDELNKLGLTVDKYLQTKGKTAEQFQAETRAEIEKNYKLEFVLEELADSESITVSAEDLKKVLAEIKDPKEKDALEKQRYYLASLLRRQKTLDKLLSLL